MTPGGGGERPVALVTGASSGIGAAVAERLAQEGFQLVIGARRAQLLADVAKRLRAHGAEVLELPLDVRDKDSIASFVAAAQERFGQVDLLVANAGIGGGGQLAETDDAQIAAMVETNLLGVVRAVRAVLPGMLARGSGHVVAIASVAGAIPIPGLVLYSATKAGLIAFCTGLRREVGHRGIAVSAILPGFIATEMTQQQGVDIRMPPPTIIAGAVMRLWRTRRPLAVVPGWYRILTAFSRIAPGTVDRITRRFNI
ncbi:MAG: SDR family oxidoreductase [Thermaerobacter sp.]|nr:SDR family oxidoreductase [Thermaerobacter sp.]